MAKTRLVLDIDFHPGTPALDRVKALIDFARDEYGVRSLVVEEVEAFDVKEESDETG